MPYSLEEATIIARFIGRDGSMGRRIGRCYRMKVSQRWLGTALIAEIRGEFVCEYGSLASFLRNWEIIPENKYNKKENKI